MIIPSCSQIQNENKFKKTPKTKEVYIENFLSSVIATSAIEKTF